jgi:hypothetical protein
LQGIDGGGKFCEGHKLDRDTATLVPASAIDRLLSPDEAGEIIRAIEREMPKRPPASSVGQVAPSGQRRA